MGKLDGKVALITGVAVGIGRVEARLFAAEGATIVASDINESGGQETVSMVKESGGEAIFVPADVTKSADIKHLVETAIQKYGRIDIIINDADFSHRHNIFTHKNGIKIYFSSHHTTKTLSF